MFYNYIIINYIIIIYDLFKKYFYLKIGVKNILVIFFIFGLFDFGVLYIKLNRDD